MECPCPYCKREIKFACNVACGPDGLELDKTCCSGRIDDPNVSYLAFYRKSPKREHVTVRKLIVFDANKALTRADYEDIKISRQSGSNKWASLNAGEDFDGYNTCTDCGEEYPWIIYVFKGQPTIKKIMAYDRVGSCPGRWVGLYIAMCRGPTVIAEWPLGDKTEYTFRL